MHGTFVWDSNLRSLRKQFSGFHRLHDGLSGINGRFASEFNILDGLKLGGVQLSTGLYLKSLTSS